VWWPAAASGAQGGAPPPQTGTGFITGRVTEGNTTRRARRDRRVIGGSGGRAGGMVGADEQGRFYSPVCRQDRFKSTRLDRATCRWRLPAAALVLAAGERRAMCLLKLVKQGALSGIVRETWRRRRGTDVMAFRRRSRTGRGRCAAPGRRAPTIVVPIGSPVSIPAST
jgi:hypothetical protein